MTLLSSSLLISTSLLLLAFLFLLTSSSFISAIRIGILTIEESGHLLPMTSIAHEAVTNQKHEIDVFLPDHAIESTKPLWPKDDSRVKFYQSVVEDERFIADHEDNYTLYQTLTESDALSTLGMITDRGHYFFKIMMPLLKENIEKAYCNADAPSSPPDVLLADYSLNNMMLALHHSIPCIRKVPLVWLWPLTLSLPTTSMSYIPALASGFTLEDLSQNSYKRIMNYVLQRVLIFGQRMDSFAAVKELMVIGGAFDGDVEKVDEYLRSEEANFDPVNDILVNHFVITPSVFGLDLAQPLCPNIRPVGFLNPPAVADSMLTTTQQQQQKKTENNKNQNDLIPSEWKDWMEETCASANTERPNILYVNMGSVAIMPTDWLHGMERVLRYVSEKENVCVVWKMRTREQKKMMKVPEHLKVLESSGKVMKEIRSGAIDLPEEVLNEQQNAIDQQQQDAKKRLTTPQKGDKFAVVARIPFAPKMLLSSTHSKTGKKLAAAFVSHCGDTSVYESLEALVPIIGVPLFADQPDMCARIVDADVGVSIHKKYLTLPNLTTSSSSSNNENNNKNDADNDNAKKYELYIRNSPLYRGIKRVVEDRSYASELSNTSSMVSKMSYLKRVGESMGGAAEAVRVLELATLHDGTAIGHFTCSTITTKLPWYWRDNWDIAICEALLVLPLVWVVMKLLGFMMGLFVSYQQQQQQQQQQGNEKLKKE